MRPFVVALRFATMPVLNGACTLDAVLGGEIARGVADLDEAIGATPLACTDGVSHASSLIVLGDTGVIPFRPPSVEDEAKRRFLEAVGLAASRIDGLIARDHGAAVRRNLAQGLGRGLRGPGERCTVWLLDPRFPLPKSMTRVIGGPDQGLAAKHLELIHCIPARFRNGPRPAVDRGRIWPLPNRRFRPPSPPPRRLT